MQFQSYTNPETPVQGKTSHPFLMLWPSPLSDIDNRLKTLEGS
jgi:hypothetical protein